MIDALLVGSYEDPDPARTQEFIACLERNLANEHIGEVHLFLEEARPGRQLAAHSVLRHSKLRLVPHGRRTTYRELFDYANAGLSGRRAIIANADIYFDHTLARLDGVELAGKLACLSRWDVGADGCLCFFDHPSSQDAWIFEAPVPPIACDFHLGLLGCDNRLAWEAQAAGLAVFNPGRSVRACHLHRSLVRRYTEQQRLWGPALSIASTGLHAPWLAFVVPCRGRLAGLRLTLESLVRQRSSSCCVVDYSCPDGAGDWVRGRYPNVIVVSVAQRRREHAAEARNLGAQAADDDAILCFLDPGATVAPDFSERVIAQLPADGFLAEEGAQGAIACRKADFLRVGGYDEVLLDPGEDHADLVDRLRLAGLEQRALPAPVLRGDMEGRVEWALGDAESSGAIQGGYRRVKRALLEETGEPRQPVELLRHIYRGIVRHRLQVGGAGAGVPMAAVTFHETMGYVVARLERGVSSHVNIERPLTDIPPTLAGKPFTQVVAFQAGPVEVEFATPGKLYVLVGTDWYGYRPATEWLAASGYREPLPPLATAPAGTFEAWSLVGAAGEKVVIPTQAMLVAHELTRRE